MQVNNIHSANLDLKRDKAVLKIKRNRFWLVQYEMILNREVKVASFHRPFLNAVFACFKAKLLISDLRSSFDAKTTLEITSVKEP